MAKRYFQENELCKPGKISNDLVEALGLNNNQLPFWIHRMRILGYPPGWLKKADITNTTIKLFDGFENDNEEGEINEIVQYNPDSFHEFPGFNAPLPDGVEDDYEKLGMPPMMPFQQLKFAKRNIQALKPVPYKRLKLSFEKKDDLSKNQDADTTTKTKSLTTSEKLTEQINLNSKSDDSSVIILDDDNEETKTQSNSNTEVSDLNNEKNSLNEKDTSHGSINKSTEQINSVFELSLSEPFLEKEDVLNNENDLNKSTSSKVTLISMGAPVPASLNGEKPPLENFAVGMGELIYFENLPTSTGVFDKMRKVIKKIRDKLS